MRILALDASTAAVGWCYAVDGNWQSSGTYDPEGDDAWDRLVDYEDWLSSWWQSLRKFGAMGPQIVMFELATGNRQNMRTNRLLGGVEYVTRKIARYRDCPIVTVTATQVRASGCHKHALPVASAIAGREVTSGDEADAIGVMLAGWVKYQGERIG